jgi:L-ascorbate metabolism protein UlaG (beta-lactamase superfamily)
MKITHIRNATIIIEIQGINILVDPMLSKKSTLPKLRYYKSKARNPLVDLPEAFHQLKKTIDYALITHCQKGHFDHLDRAGVHWLNKNQTPTFCTSHDANYLDKKGINTNVLAKRCNPFFNGSIEQIPAKHTRGWLTPFMEHGVGYYIKIKNEPSVYLMGDTVLTDEIRKFIYDNQPEYIVAPTGKAQFDIGAPLLLDEKEIVELASLSKGVVIANHMEALDHCRISRADLSAILIDNNLNQRFMIPQDGQTLNLV